LHPEGKGQALGGFARRQGSYYLAVWPRRLHWGRLHSLHSIEAYGIGDSDDRMHHTANRAERNDARDPRRASSLTFLSLTCLPGIPGSRRTWWINFSTP